MARTQIHTPEIGPNAVMAKAWGRTARRMGILPLLAFAAFALALMQPGLSGPAAAQSFYTGNWEGKAVMRGKTFTRCEVWVEFVNDRRLYFAQLDNDSMWVSMGHPSWRFDPNARTTMQFRIYRERRVRGDDGKITTRRTRQFTKDLRGTIVRSRPNQIWFPLAGDVKLRAALQTSDLLYIEDKDGLVGGQRKSYGFRLNNVRSALLKLQMCKLLYGTK